MMTRLLFFALLIASPVWALEEADTVTLQSGATTTGNGTATSVTRHSTIGLDVEVTNTATVTFEGRSDGAASFSSMRCTNRATGSASTTATATGNYECPVAGLGEVRARISSCTGCVVNVFARLTTAPPGLASAGAGGGGDASLAEQQSQTALLTTMDTDTGNIAASMGLLDDAVHASDAALSKVLAIGCQFDDSTPGTTTEDSVRAVRCSTRRELYGQIRDAAGNERGANVNASNELQVQLGTPAAMADAESNPTLPKIAVYNKIWNGSTWDRATKADVGAGAAGSNTQRVLLATDQTVSDPCTFRAKTVVPFSISTATTTQLAAASASNKLYVCSLNILAAAADNVALVEDDTSACASPTAGMAGGTTAATGWNFAANGGLTLGNGSGTVMVSAATNRYVCLITSAATQLSGAMSYVLAP